MTTVFAGALIQAAFVVALAGPIPAMPAALVQEAIEPPAVQDGHVHEGEIGELLLALERNLRCDCGCTLDVHSCQYQMQCGTSPVWSARILAGLEAGETPEAIEAGFVADFGPTVLMEPPEGGFSVVGYLLPALALIMGGALVGLVIRGGLGQERVPATGSGLTEADEARLAEELRRLDEAEGPDW